MNGLLGAALILLAVAFFERAVALGVAVGAVLAVANFTGMRRLVAASLRRQGGRRAALQLLLIAKMGVLFLLVFLAIRYLPLHPVGLAVGLSVFLISITVESVRWAQARIIHEQPSPTDQTQAAEGATREWAGAHDRGATHGCAGDGPSGDRAREYSGLSPHDQDGDGNEAHDGRA